MFSIEEYSNLLKLLSSYQRVIITQPVLTEVCNHLDGLNGRENFQLFPFVRELVKLKGFEITNQTFQNILDNKAFEKFGFADSSMELLVSGNTLLTNDGSFYGYVVSKSQKAIFWGDIKKLNF